MSEEVQANRDEIDNMVWKACDSFRGAVDPAEYKTYILTMLFIKYISDLWKDKRKGYEKKYNDDEVRVNRLHEKKKFGYIIDYRGILEDLDHAFDLYNVLAEFDAKDLECTLTDVNEQIATLPQKYSLLLDTFKEVKNKNDQEEYERLPADEALRTRFYERLSSFARTLAIAMSTVRFPEETAAEKIDRYRNDLKFFSKLRASVRRRYAEVVEFSEYEPKIRKLLDTHVGSGEIEQITPLVDIFDKEAFAGIALEVEHIIERNRIVNWVNDMDIQNRMRTDIEDLIFDLKEQTGVDIGFEKIDEIMEHCIDIAVTRRP